jgi:hypothetical protein
MKEESKCTFLVSWKHSISQLLSFILFLIDGHFSAAFIPLTFQHNIFQDLFIEVTIDGKIYSMTFTENHHNKPQPA